MMKYDSALRDTRGALGPTAMVYEDSTLASVLLLALFECINPTTEGIKNWCSHIMGGISLVKEFTRKKGAKQIERSLFISIRTQTVIYSLATLTTDDDEAWWPQDSMDKYTSIQRLCMEASSLGAQARVLFAPNQGGEYAMDLFKQCRYLDQRFKNWWETSFTIAQPGDFSANIAIGYDHTSSELLTICNTLLYARALLNLIIIRCTARIYESKRHDFKTSEEYAEAFLELKSLTSDCIAMNNQQRDKVGLGTRGYFMIWPLALMLSSKCLAQGQESIVHEQLKYIGRFFRICGAYAQFLHILPLF